MALLNQVRVAWTGLRGLPGVSTFYFEAQSAVPLAALKTFFSSVSGAIPSGCLLTFPANGSKIDTSTGQTVGTWTATPPTALSGTGSGPYAAPAGMLVNWHTGLYVNGRELRGKTFIVPVISASYESDGSAGAAWITSLQNAATALIASGTPPHVYGRSTATDAPALSGSVPDKVVMLTTRRD